ncbi:SDR family oxidoreductase [Undibacterium sp. RuTC16W]|uniref:SDR family oxidoreductase n=1 Tax=Undibacterium sp. RuTC16W TaxID=3413048 RepID=UPI003BF1EB23
MSVQRRVIIITGASDGIGAEVARQLARSGGSHLALVLAARNTDMLDAVAATCQQSGCSTLVVQTDVGVQAQCIALIEKTVAQFGRIDALINNAGKSAQALLEDVTDLGWYEDLMRINLWGSVWCTHAALPHIKVARGNIVAVSSLAGLMGVPGRTAYCTTKFAMNGFFEALRAEVKDAGVSVTLAYPGVVATQIRYRGYNASGVAAGSSGLKEDDAMSVEECAGLIIKGMEQRQRDVVMSAKGKLGRWLKLLAPGLVEKMTMAALKKEVRPH